MIFGALDMAGAGSAGCGEAGAIGAPPQAAATIESADGSRRIACDPGEGVIVAFHASAGKAPTQGVHGRCLGWRAPTVRDHMTERIPVILNASSGPHAEAGDGAV